VNVSIHDGKKSVAKGVQIDLEKVRNDYKSRLAEVHAAAGELAQNPRLSNATSMLEKGKDSLHMVVRLDLVKGSNTLDNEIFVDDSEGETVEIMRESATKMEFGIFDTPLIGSEVSLFSPTPLLEPPVASSGANRIVATQINVSSIDIPEDLATDVDDSEQQVVNKNARKRKRDEKPQSPERAQRATRVSAPESESSRERGKILLRMKEKVVASVGKEISKKYEKKPAARTAKPADVAKTAKKRQKLNFDEE
jgi:hypothetical protein